MIFNCIANFDCLFQLLQHKIFFVRRLFFSIVNPTLSVCNLHLDICLLAFPKPIISFDLRCESTEVFSFFLPFSYSLLINCTMKSFDLHKLFTKVHMIPIQNQV